MVLKGDDEGKMTACPGKTQITVSESPNRVEENALRLRSRLIRCTLVDRQHVSLA